MENKTGNKLVEFFRRYWLLTEYLVLCIFSLIPLLIWFKHGYYIDGADYSIPIRVFEQFYRESFFWDSHIYLGTPSLGPLWLTPYALFWVVLKCIGLGFIAIEKLWFVLMFIGPGLAMHYFISNFFKERQSRMPRLACSIFYMINPIIMGTVFGSMTVTPMGIIMFPLLIGMYVRFKKNVRNAVIFSLITFALGTMLAQNLAILISVALFFFLYVLVDFMFSGNKKEFAKQGVKFFFIAGIILLLTGLWWIFPYFQSVSTSDVTQQKLSVKNVEFSFKDSTLLNEFRLLGEWCFPTWHNSRTPYISYAENYYKYMPFWLTVGLFIPAIIFLFSLMIKSRIRKEHPALFIFLPLLFILALFFAKGTMLPLGEIFEKLYPYFFWMYKAAWRKFMVFAIFPIAVGIAIVFDYLGERIKTKVVITLFIAFILLVSAISYPLIFGLHLRPDKKGDFVSESIKIPEYWYNMSGYINGKNENSRILLLPRNDFYMVPYKWNNGTDGYRGCDVAPRLINNPVIAIEPSGSYIAPMGIKFLDGFYANLKAKSKFERVLKYLGVGYVLQRNDYDFDVYRNPETTKEYMHKILKRNESLKLEKTIGELELYKVNKTLPVIYAAGQYLYYENIVNLIKLMETDLAYNNDFVFFSNDSVDENNQAVVSKTIKKYALTSSNSKNTTLDIGLDSLSAGKLFQVKMDKIKLKGDNADICLVSKGDETCYSYPNEVNLTEIGFFVNPETDAEYKITLKAHSKLAKRSFNIYFYSNSWHGSPNAVQYSNISLMKIVSPELHTIEELNSTEPLVMAYSENMIGPNSGVNFVKNTYDCCRTINNLPAKVSHTAYADKENNFYSILLESENHCACNFLTLTLEHGNCYQLKFEYKEIEGTSRASYSLGDDVDTVTYLPDDWKGSKSRNWENYQKYFCFDNKAVTEIAIENITIIEYPSETSAEKQNVSFEIINPAHYEVSISLEESKPYYLVFTDSFNPGWVLVAHEKGKNPSWISVLLGRHFDAKHTVANGYANSWVLEKEKINKALGTDMLNKEIYLTIYYKPQAYFYFGIVIALAVLALCTAYLIWRRKT